MALDRLLEVPQVRRRPDTAAPGDPTENPTQLRWEPDEQSLGARARPAAAASGRIVGG